MDDGAGSIRGQNTGCGPTTVRVWGVKKKPLLLDYIALTTVRSKSVTIWQMARRLDLVVGLQPNNLPLLNPPRSSTRLLHRTKWEIPLKLHRRERVSFFGASKPRTFVYIYFSPKSSG